MRNLIWLFLLGVLLVGCGTGNQEPDQKNEDENNSNKNDIVAGEMEPSLTEQQAFSYQYQVTNQTEDKITLEFTSSQRFDYSVETKDGEQLFLFSSVASFMQVLGEEKIKPGESLEYSIDLTELDLSQGEYVLNVWMTPTEGKKYQVSQEFSVNE
ncbi:BsuPI-related putative proteinase inhibitor [Aquibacillus saliphilus]|uniref:BsuPI-related putative proteinase inhibitor n=1 Tax=Aquibacillus saliphilus TaxID=1909422 RepID=UPI001CF08FEE|nr:BsuPI-related putative proteinase inhibitor [Aquibacillus saliphilus]